MKPTHHKKKENDMEFDLLYDLVRDDVSDAAMPRATRVYTGHYPDTLTRPWEGQ